MRRREFISILGGAAAAWPLAGQAQQAAIPVIGFLNSASPGAYAINVAAFGQGLKEAGYIDGQNVSIEYLWAEGQYDRLPAMAVELIRRQVTVIAATSTPAALVAQKSTTKIPIVFTTSSDPVHLGLVASLNRPGGNVTGVTQLNVEVAPKRVELMHELVPTATTIALLVNPTNPNVETVTRELQAAVQNRRLRSHVLHASNEHEIDSAFATLDRLRADGVVIGSDVFFNTRTEQLAALAFHRAVPAIYHNREFTSAGGLDELCRQY